MFQWLFARNSKTQNQELEVKQTPDQNAEVIRSVFSEHYGSQSGISVSPDNAMRNATVFGCARVLSESVAQLPLLVYKRLDRGREELYNDPIYPLLAESPNSYQTAYEFFELLVWDLLFRGNAFVFKNMSTTGRVLELLRMHPDRFRVEQLDDWSLRYRVRNPDGAESVYSDKEIIHLRGFSRSGFLGASIFDYARDVIGQALAQEKFGAKVFANGAWPGVVLKIPQGLRDEEAVKRLKQDWKSSFSNDNAFKTAVLENGMEVEKVGMTSEDAQFLESRKFSRNEICAIFRVPPHKVADLERATFSNIEHQDLDFLKSSLMPWLRRIEQSFTKALLPERDRYAQFNTNEFVRGDIKARYEAMTMGINAGFITRNEARAADNRNPIEGLDEPLTPLNMATGPNTDEDENA